MSQKILEPKIPIIRETKKFLEPKIHKKKKKKKKKITQSKIFFGKNLRSQKLSLKKEFSQKSWSQKFLKFVPSCCLTIFPRITTKNLFLQFQIQWLMLCLNRESDSRRRTRSDQYAYQIAEIQQKTHKRASSVSSSENFSSSRSDSWRQNHHHCGIPLRLLDPKRRASSWLVTRKTSQDSNLSSSRNDSSGSATTQSTSTWRMSRSSASSDHRTQIIPNADLNSNKPRTKPRLTRQSAITDDSELHVPPGSPGRLTVRFLTTIPSAAETSVQNEEETQDASPEGKKEPPQLYPSLPQGDSSSKTNLLDFGQPSSNITIHACPFTNIDEKLLESPKKSPKDSKTSKSPPGLLTLSPGPSTTSPSSKGSSGSSPQSPITYAPSAYFRVPTAFPSSGGTSGLPTIRSAPSLSTPIGFSSQSPSPTTNLTRKNHDTMLKEEKPPTSSD